MLEKGDTDLEDVPNQLIPQFGYCNLVTQDQFKSFA